MSAKLAPVPATRAPETVMPPSPSLWQAAWRRLIRRPTVVLSMLYIAVLIVAAIFAKQIAPYPPDFQDYAAVRLNPFSGGHVMGTDTLGRDIFSRMIYGTRISMSVAAVVLLIALALGLTLGLVAGYYGGVLDMAIMRLTDIMFAFPDMLLALLIMGIRGPGMANLFIALGIVAWPNLARLVRGQVLSLKEADFIQAANSLGSNDRRIILRHLLPNLMSPVLVTATLSIAGVILSEATLSFLGIGIRPPTPSWGSMLNEMIAMIYSQPVLLVGPSLILAVTVLSFNFLGDGLRDALDPRLKR